MSRTPLSSRASQNVGCVSQKREATGEAFATVEQIIDAHNPEEVTLECVKTFMQANKTLDENKHDSDALF